MEKEVMEAIYISAKSVYDGKKSLAEAKEYINKAFNVNVNSFADYYRAFKMMLDGGQHKRIISSGLRDYFLSKIYEVYGKDKLSRALEVYMNSILYYEETHNNCTLHTDRAVYQKYVTILHSL